MMVGWDRVGSGCAIVADFDLVDGQKVFGTEYFPWTAGPQLLAKLLAARTDLASQMP